MDTEKISSILIRVGIAFAFIYAAIAGFVNPDNWIGYFPTFMQDILPGNSILTLWGIVEIILAIWILSGRRIFIPSLIGALSLCGLILFNFASMDILFRDVTILCVLLALAVREYRPRLRM